MLINNTRHTPINTDNRVENTKPLTADEVKAKVKEVQTNNLQAIQDGIAQNTAGWGDKVKIKVPADASGKPIQNPTAQDWENAAKNNRFVEVEDTPARLASSYYGVSLVDFGNSANNKAANNALLQELRDALGQGITFPTTQPLPTSPAGDLVRALLAREEALKKIQRGMGDPNAGTSNPPSYGFDIKVPADASGKPIQNPSIQDWIDAQKNNRWATVNGNSEKLAASYFGLKLEAGGNWRDAHKVNLAALNRASQNGIGNLEAKIKIANGEFSVQGILDIPDAGKIIEEVLAVLGPAYTNQLQKANDVRGQMDSLKKKNDALNKLENSVSTNNTAGSNAVDFDVPTKRYVLDKDGNKVLDSNGKPKTEDVKPPPSDQDWANAAEFKSIRELNGNKDINGRDAAKKYFNIDLSNTTGDNAHNINLSNNLTKIGNARSQVNAEMTKLSGQFDFFMGNAQTNLQNANKLISSLNDMNMAIARSI
jgi:hypothetical protein